MDYWEECVRIALDDCGLSATEDQIDCIVGAVESGQENYGMAHGYDAIPNPLSVENSKLEAELKKERNKIICPVCKGRGRLITHGPCHSGNSECFRCRGEGRTSP